MKAPSYSIPRSPSPAPHVHADLDTRLDVIEANDWVTAARIAAGAVGPSEAPGLLGSNLTQGKLYAGSSVVLTNGSGDATIDHPDFGTAHAGLIVTNGDATIGSLILGVISSGTASSTVRVFSEAGTALTGFTCRINWIAVGY